MTERAHDRWRCCPKRSRSARVMGAIVAVATVSVLLVGCGGTSPTKRLFRSPFLSFRYPASWDAHRYQDFATLSTLIVYLSNQRLHQLCAIRHGTHNTTIACHQPIKRLQPHSILAWWEEEGKPGWSYKRLPGSSILMGAQHVKLQVWTPDGGVGATAGIEADVQIPGNADGWDQFIACIRGPGTTRLEQQARALLDTVTFPKAS